MTMDIMCAGRPVSNTKELLLPIAIQDQIRMCLTPAREYAARAFHFYEVERNERSPEVAKYLELFYLATGVSGVDCILGGLDHTIREAARDFDEIASCWHAVPRASLCENPKEAEVLHAYEAVRMRSLRGLRALIREREEDRPIRDWNLIALAQAPICDLGDMGAFVLNHTVLGRSLFDSVRHAILTAAREGRLPSPYTNEKAVGELYGKIFESYVYSIFQAAHPHQTFRIPEAHGEQRADLLVWFPDKLIVAEVKGVHFVGLRHASYLSIDERRGELNRIGMPNAVNQIASTIRAIRAGEVSAPSMPSYDWTTTPIVPLVVTEELMPQVLWCWETFYAPMTNPLEELTGGGPVGKLRFLTIDEVETVQDLSAPIDLGTLLYRWGGNPDYTEHTWDQFLAAQEVSYQNRFIAKNYRSMMRFLARRLDLDESLLARSDGWEAGTNS